MSDRAMSDAVERREGLKALYLEEARDCTRCALSASRTQVVFGAGDADANLMFVGEAPGANEDRTGLPFVGQAGKLLDKLLEEIGMSRSEVFIANVLKCRPPSNRDPQPNEIETCSPYLREQVRLIEPQIVCTLGNFATKLLRDDPTGIRRLHGRPEVRTLGSRRVWLLPLFHPAAALYQPSTLDLLRADFARIPALLEEPLPADDPLRVEEPLAVVGNPLRVEEPAPADEPPSAESPAPTGKAVAEPQLGLFD